MTCGQCIHIDTENCLYKNMIPKRQPTDDDASSCQQFYPKVKQDKTKDVIITTPGQRLNNCLFEQIYNSFIVKHADDTIETVPELEIEGKHYKPMSQTPWPLTSKPIETDPETLHQEIRTLLYDPEDFIDERHYDIVTCWIIATWRQEDFNTAPYLFFLGPKESGKTRALEILQSLTYRGIETANITPANLYRPTELWKPTLLVDESEVINRNPELKSILNSRYRRGCVVLREEKDANGSYTPKTFDVYGFTALAGTNGFHNTLESRCITINMEKTVRKLKPFKPDSEKAKELRSKLLYYRLENLGSPLPEIDMSDFTNDRLAELFQPLIAVAPIKKQSILREYAAAITKERIDEEESGTEAQILNSLIRTLDQTENGRISTKTITEQLNNDITDPKSQWRTISVGRILTRLGFKPTRMTDGNRGIKLNKQHLTRLMKRYNITTQTTLDTLLPTPTESVKSVKSVKPHLENQIQIDRIDRYDSSREHQPIETLHHEES